MKEEYSAGVPAEEHALQDPVCVSTDINDFHVNNMEI